MESKKSESPITTIFVGNPGTGKSTLLNSFFGRKVFESGVSIGKGLTTTLQIETDDKGNKWADTPGLNDPKIREQAAAEISKGLKQGGLYRIVFAVIVDAGRVRPEDKVTMQLILDATKLRVSEYGILINKVPKKTKVRIESNIKTEGAELLTLLTDGLTPTQYIHLNVKRDDLEDEDNVVIDADPEILAFLESIPTVGLDPSKVEDIKPDRYAEMSKKFDAELTKMKEDSKLLNEKYEETRKKLEEAQNGRGGGGCFAYGSQLLKRTLKKNEKRNHHRFHQQEEEEQWSLYQVSPIEEIDVGDEVLTYDENGNLFWDIVALVDENKEAQEMRVQMVKIILEGLEHEKPLLLTHHHYVFIVDQDGHKKQVLAREVRVNDNMIIFDSLRRKKENEGPSSSWKLPRKVVSAEFCRATYPVKNIITAHTRTVLVDGVLCSVHCEGDWGEAYFKVGYFLWMYVSREIPQMMLKFHKWMKYSTLKKTCSKVK